SRWRGCRVGARVMAASAWSSPSRTAAHSDVGPRHVGAEAVSANGDIRRGYRSVADSRQEFGDTLSDQVTHDGAHRVRVRVPVAALVQADLAFEVVGAEHDSGPLLEVGEHAGP